MAEKLADVVLVVGAGASVGFGLPDGVGLSRRISEFLQNTPNLDQAIATRGGNTQEFTNDEHVLFGILGQDSRRYLGYDDMRRLAPVLKRVSRQLPLSPSIDSYIRFAPDDTGKKLAKALIVHLLSDAEKNALGDRRTFSTPDGASSDRFERALLPVQNAASTEDRYIDFSRLQESWLMLLFRLLAADTDFEALKARFSRIAIVNFNYDRILEHFLFFALLGRGTFSLDQVRELLETITMIRPYGTLGKMPWATNSTEENSYDFGEISTGIQILSRAHQIKTISEGTLDDAEQTVAQKIAHSLSHQTKKVVFLGFGFSRENLELFHTPEQGWRNVYATCFGFSNHRQELLKSSLSRFKSAGAGGSGQIFLIPDTCETLLYEHGSEIFEM